MTGNDVYNRAIGLLGYVNTNLFVTPSDIVLKRVLDVINQVCLDLDIPVIDRLSDEIVARYPKLDALCYGTATILAIMEGDGAKNELFTQLYNRKRLVALSYVDKIQDKLPTTSDGVD